MKFYDMKARTTVELPDSACTKVEYTHPTKASRYAFRGLTTDGHKVVKFCSKADFDAAVNIPVVAA